MYKIFFTLVLAFNTSGGNLFSQQQLDAKVEKTDIYDGSSLGSAKITINGGSAPYYILWSSGSTQPKVTALKPGTYVVRVSDSKGRTIEKQIKIEDRSSTTLSSYP